MLEKLDPNDPITPAMLLEDYQFLTGSYIDSLVRLSISHRFTPEARFIILTHLLAKLLPLALAQRTPGLFHTLNGKIIHHLTETAQNLISVFPEKEEAPFPILMNITTIDFQKYKQQKENFREEKMVGLELLKEINLLSQSIKANHSDNKKAVKLLPTLFQEWLSLTNQFEFNLDFVHHFPSKQNPPIEPTPEQIKIIREFYDSFQQNMFSTPKTIIDIWTKTVGNPIDLLSSLLNEADKQSIEIFLANSIYEFDVTETLTKTAIPTVVSAPEKTVVQMVSPAQEPITQKDAFPPKLAEFEQSILEFILQIDKLKSSMIAKNILNHKELLNKLDCDFDQLDEAKTLISKFKQRFKEIQGPFRFSLDDLKEDYARLASEFIFIKLKNNELLATNPNLKLLKTLLSSPLTPETQFMLLTLAMGLEMKRIQKRNFNLVINSIQHQMDNYLTYTIVALEENQTKNIPSELIQLLQKISAFFSSLPKSELNSFYHERLSAANYATTLLDKIEDATTEIEYNTLSQWLSRWMMLARQLEKNLNALQDWAEIHPEVDSNSPDQTAAQESAICFYNILSQKVFSNAQTVLDQWTLEMKVPERASAIDVTPTTMTMLLLVTTNVDGLFFKKFLPQLSEESQENEINSLPVYPEPTAHQQSTSIFTPRL